MFSFKEEYKTKLKAADEAVKLVQNGDVIVVPTGCGEPPTLLTALSEQRHQFKDVKVSQILPLRKFGYFDKETSQNVRPYAYFLGGPSRPIIQEGFGDYIPHYFGELPDLIRRKYIKTDVVFSLASPMDEHGYFSLSIGTDYTLDAAKNARAVVLEVNPNVPYAFGNNQIHISQVAAVVENDDPLIEVGLPEIGPIQKEIGKLIADMIPDGATLQIGYGSIPDAVVMQLNQKNDLGIHTEMVGDGILSMIESGVVNNKNKNYLPGKMVATFALGSNKLFKYMHRNPQIEMHPVDFTNDPYLAGLNDNLIAINSTMQIDFVGQCGSESQGFKPYSGTGGQSDFMRAANRSKGGKGIICMPSTAKNDTISRIAPVLSPGTHVTTSKNDINYVVTEYGVAQLRGKSAHERTRELIAIAHPKFRDELKDEAKKMGLW
ncbi:acetyl-CoA hydrolase/transferase C-terminal domain-containing protein [Microvirga sp. W0021]|uniref:Acetyl-CoA hydrolase/transferase C-terminal domain-containing protein n=1 Tax=Hohaiivirga grylli TaxID=3133970 RepID=A0ABV0BKT5_9HYPH